MSRSAFVHQGCVYACDDEFVQTAVPFIVEGLERDEPVLVATTAANIGLLRAALGRRAHRVDFGETGGFGGRPQQRISAFTAYRHRHPRDERVRILAEPSWTGCPPRRVEVWECMESALNTVLGGTGIHMVCPYDSRNVPPGIVANVRRTHPEMLSGTDARPSAAFVRPLAFVRRRTAPLPSPPRDAVTLVFGGDLGRMRHAIVLETAALGLLGEHMMIFSAAVGEIVGGAAGGHGRPTVALWAQPGEVVCDVRLPMTLDPFIGLHPPTIDPTPGDGFWLARQICDHLDVRPGPDGTTVRLHTRVRRAPR